MSSEKKGKTPLKDASGIKVRAKTQEELNEYEFKNNLKANKKYILLKLSDKNVQFSYDWLMQVHKEMFGDVWEWAGTKRSSDLNLGVPKEKIGQELHRLIYDINNTWKMGRLSIEDIAVRIHHRLVWIHPFPDGNGRHARLIANIFLKKNGYEFIAWPDREDDQFRDEYLAALKQADKDDFSPLKKLHQKIR